MRELHAGWRTILLLLLAAAAILPYLQVRDFELLTFDDRYYIWDNPHVHAGLTWRGVQWAFTTFSYANWHPITWLSHMLDCELFARENDTQWAGGHHLVNVLLHAANTLLLFTALRAMTGAMWRSTLVAALFAVHPLHVESVAWVAERKDVLSTCFGLLAIRAYVRYVKQPSIGRYALVAAAFACSLMSKPMLVTLPFILLLLDDWPLNRLARAGLKRAILDKLPLLALSAASSVITVTAQKSGGAMVSLEALSLMQRIANAAVSYVQYLVKMIWPRDLAAIYPLPERYTPVQVGFAVFILVAISVLVIAFRRSRRYLLTGWLWYLGALVPVIGLMQVGLQAMADRYTYVPLIGIFIMIAWSVPDLRRMNWVLQSASLGAIGLLVIVLAQRAWVQTSYWRDTTTLFGHTLAVTYDNPAAHMHMAFALQTSGRSEEAVAHYQEALRGRVHSPSLYFNYASALMNIGRVEQAIPLYQRAIAMAPQSMLAHYNLGLALGHVNRSQEAIPHFQKAIDLQPDFADAYFRLGMAHIALQQTGRAIDAYRKAIELNHQMTEAHKQLGVALAIEGRLNEAIDSFSRALEIAPGDAQAQTMLQQARQQREAAGNPQ